MSTLPAATLEEKESTLRKFKKLRAEYDRKTQEHNAALVPKPDTIGSVHDILGLDLDKPQEREEYNEVKVSSCMTKLSIDTDY